MSANPVILPNAGHQNEPSMEEILASIRRIISDDNPASKSDAVEMSESKITQEPEEDEDDILDLAEVAVKTAAPSPLNKSNTLNALENALGVSKPAPAPLAPNPPAPPVVAYSPPPPPAPLPAPAPIHSVKQLEERILSEETGMMVSQAMQALSRNATPTTPAPSSRSIEEVVVDALRPFLRSWLDDHLPGIVERLVKAEIERVTR